MIDNQFGFPYISYMNKEFKTLTLGLAILIILSACSSTYRNTQSSRTAVEQLLISEALMSSLSQKVEAPLPIPPGSKVHVSTSGISSDQHIVEQAISGWLGQHGYFIQEDKDKATYEVSVMVESLGTEYANTFAGIPPIRGGFLPISTPELAIYKAQYQTGYVKFHFDLFELPSGRYVQTTSPFVAEKYFNDYTALFIFTFRKTDLAVPPQLGTIGRKKGSVDNQ